MVVQYHVDDSGMTFYSDSPFNADEASLRNLLDCVGQIAGVEATTSGRYYFDCSFGLLFEYEDVSEQILDAVKKHFDIFVIEPIDVVRLQQRKMRSLGISTDGLFFPESDQLN